MPAAAAWADTKADRYLAQGGWNSEEPADYSAMTVSTPEDAREVYPIGTGEWTWRDAD